MVIVYTTPTCPHCKSAKRYLSERKVPFREVDVTRSEEGLKSLKRKSGQTGVPVIDVNGQIIVGFNRPKLDRALGIRSVE
ncbi:glutaredoxin [Sulfobacillus acidophilus DSM 10332]|jgi:glutaredoxin 3|uniref:Glutaredoxin n=1 Tax=Sulfobacillus acidophilus (strain ATCC 700253 / DSM 10332 / NAL) TaxID=679936 RepID=G8TYB3_SULAD|nr:glutaredoxin [Sulfobacillus acidophilus DSM 10332]